VSVLAAVAALVALAISLFTLLVVIGLARRVRAGGSQLTPAGSGLAAVTLPSTGRPVPEFRFLATDGQPIQDSRLTSGRHGVAFVSSSCDACLDSLPEFVELARQVGDRSLAVLLDDSRDRNRTVMMIDRLGSATTLIIDNETRDVGRRFEVVSLPTFLGVHDGVIELASHRVGDLAGWLAG